MWIILRVSNFYPSHFDVQHNNLFQKVTRLIEKFCKNRTRFVDTAPSICTHFRMASVRLWFLLSLGRCAAEALAEELLIWTTGRGALGAETLRAMPALPPLVASGTVADAVVTGVAVVTADDVATPTGYIPMLCAVSPSPVVDDTVEVPVVPELGDGCLKTEEEYYSRAEFMEEVAGKGRFMPSITIG